MKKILLVLLLSFLMSSCFKDEYTVECYSKQLNANTVNEFVTYKEARAWKVLTENGKMYLPDSIDAGGYPIEIPNDCHCDIK